MSTIITEISQSMQNQWFRCPHQFERVWIMGERIPPGIAARIGTGLHTGAHVNFAAKYISGNDEPLEVVQDAAKDGYIKAVQEGVFFPPDEVSGARKQIEEGVDVTVDLAKLFRLGLAPQIQPVLIEENIYLSDPRLPVPFRGTIDVLDESNWLIDIKSSKNKWAAGKADSEIQPTLYNELVREKTGEYPRKITFEVFTKTKREHHSIETTRTREDYEKLVIVTEQMIKCINEGIFLPAPPGSWQCSMKWCGFYLTCKYIPNHRKIIPKRSV
jgi:hypothetical protein